MRTLVLAAMLLLAMPSAAAWTQAEVGVVDQWRVCVGTDGFGNLTVWLRPFTGCDPIPYGSCLDPFGCDIILSGCGERTAVAVATSDCGDTPIDVNDLDEVGFAVSQDLAGIKFCVGAFVDEQGGVDAWIDSLHECGSGTAICDRIGADQLCDLFGAHNA